jgi:hypothetical protein
MYSKLKNVALFHRFLISCKVRGIKAYHLVAGFSERAGDLPRNPQDESCLTAGICGIHDFVIALVAV